MGQFVLHEDLSASVASHVVAGVVVYCVLHTCKSPESYSSACMLLCYLKTLHLWNKEICLIHFLLPAPFSSKASLSDENTLSNVVHVGSMDCTCSVIPFLSQS